MTRENLIRSKEFWMVQIQNNLYGIIADYMKKNKLNQTELGQRLGFTKGYISQVLKGSFDHKISKLVDLALSSNNIPFVAFINADEYIASDAADKYYDLIPMCRPQYVLFQDQESYVLEAGSKEDIPVPQEGMFSIQE